MFICIRATESSAPLQALGVLARLAWINWLDLTYDPHLVLKSRPKIVLDLQIMIRITNIGKCPSYLSIAFARNWREL